MFAQFICLLIVVPMISIVQLKADSNFNFNFSKGHDGWIGNFADYPVGQEAFYDLNWGWTNLPYPLPTAEKGMVLSGSNHSDDLMMFIKRQVEGLEPNTEYDVTFDVTIETNVPVGQIGVGGAPGESVFFKVGASALEPLNQVQDNFYRLNIDIGSQGNGGNDGIVIGDLANPAVDVDNITFMPKEMSSPHSLKVKTDENGRLWLLVGTDSGFEGTSLYYIANISVKLDTGPVDSSP